MKDYYSILEVSPTATLAEIKRSYRRLVRLHHPDLNAQALDTHIKLLNEAYSVLGDAEKRAHYDAQVVLQHKQELAECEAQMTWLEGFAGFVAELKKGLRDEN